jgi:hypothetical protein
MGNEENKNENQAETPPKVKNTINLIVKIIFWHRIYFFHLQGRSTQVRVVGSAIEQVLTCPSKHNYLLPKASIGVIIGSSWLYLCTEKQVRPQLHFRES